MEIFKTSERRDKLHLLPGFKPTPDGLVIVLHTQDEIDQLFGLLNHYKVARCGVPVIESLYQLVKKYRTTQGSDKYFSKVAEALS